MSLEQLNTYFMRWLSLTVDQREYLKILLISQKFDITDVIELLNTWYGERPTFPDEVEEIQEPEVPPE